MIIFKNILIATDFGEASEAARNYGRDLAHTYGSTFDVLHAVDDVMPPFATAGAVAAPPDLLTEVEDTPGKRVDALATEGYRREFLVPDALVASARA